MVVVVGATVVVVVGATVVVVGAGTWAPGSLRATACTARGAWTGSVAARQPMPTVATSAAMPTPATRPREIVVMARPSAAAHGA